MKKRVCISGGYKGTIQDGHFSASGVAKASVNMKLNKGQGIDVKIQLPKGQARAGPVQAHADLSASVQGGLSKDGKDFKAGLEGSSFATGQFLGVWNKRDF